MLCSMTVDLEIFECRRRVSARAWAFRDFTDKCSLSSKEQIEILNYHAMTRPQSPRVYEGSINNLKRPTNWWNTICSHPSSNKSREAPRSVRSVPLFTPSWTPSISASDVAGQSVRSVSDPSSTQSSKPAIVSLCIRYAVRARTSARCWTSTPKCTSCSSSQTVCSWPSGWRTLAWGVSRRRRCLWATLLSRTLLWSYGIHLTTPCGSLQ